MLGFAFLALDEFGMVDRIFHWVSPVVNPDNGELAFPLPAFLFLTFRCLVEIPFDLCQIFF